jgi:hypothetical protein
MLLQAIDRHFANQYDFFYLPIDFKNRCNMGYAFINFVDSVYICDFFSTFNDQKWEKFNSDKICKISYGRIQGKKALENNFSNMSTVERGMKVRPLILDIQGPTQEEVMAMRSALLKSHKKKKSDWEQESASSRGYHKK